VTNVQQTAVAAFSVLKGVPKDCRHLRHPVSRTVRRGLYEWSQQAMSCRSRYWIRSVHGEHPKCLIEVDDSTILDHQLEALSLAGFHDVAIVVG
jgi:hypothetical protein